ncbi:hypothetical protein [Algoriphagus halophilus]|uniref:hypothetical protein n=1 Tax=Algoriphagus halophilus TaxID=226505 RepID=UPI00358E7A90
MEEVFVSDITYVRRREDTLSKFSYGCMHKEKSWDMSPSDDMAQHVVKALQMAIKTRKTKWPLIHHSDRGLQYCSSLYQQTLQEGKNPDIHDRWMLTAIRNVLLKGLRNIGNRSFLWKPVILDRI